MSAILDQLRSRAGRTPVPIQTTPHEEEKINEVGRKVFDRLATQHERNAAARPATAVAPVRLANDKQKGLMRYLLSQLRTHNVKVYLDAAPWVERNLETLSFTAISDVINRLRAHLAAPGVDAPTQPEPQKRAWDAYDDIPDGYYAVSNNDGDTSFYRVRRHDGRMFIDLQVSDSFNRIPWTTRKAALDKIRTDGPQAAGERYARELGRCYRCGRTLTDETSRELGIGPTCRKK